MKRASTRLQAQAKTRQKKFLENMFSALFFLHRFKSECLISLFDAYVMP